MGKGSLWVRAAAAVASLALSAVAQPGFAADKPKPDEMVNNPPFQNWSGFPVGTAITQKETVKLNDGTTVAIDTTSKLVKKDKDSVVVETTMGEAGAAAQTGMAGESKTTTTFPAKVKMSQTDTPASAGTSVTEGTESIDYQGKTVTAEWTNAVIQNGDETTEEKIWTLKDIPGGIVRRTIVQKKGGQIVSSSVLELVTVKPGA
ncbi:MAG TPA: hypothetical protein VFD92_24275 [Candidatus Binatia bacterium]|nr:hypothetical protein [Candidatus Binatia bacterium]